jgi:hypothetical protein
MNLEQRYQILSSAKVGIEFEMYSEMNAKEVAKDLSRSLGKKVIIPVVIKGLGEEEKGGYHSEFEPTAFIFKLERDFSGGKDMYEMITGPLTYEESRIILIKMLQWIKEKGWTDEKCAIHLNVSLNGFKSKLRTPLINLNVLKFILSFDEEFIYSRFPSRKHSVYAKSIDNFYPQSRFTFFDKPDNIDKSDYILPHEKYFGVNFTKLPKNYLELRYLGGEGYENKTFKILEILDYFITKLYSTLQQNDVYTPDEKAKLYKTLKAQKKAVQTFSNPEMFLISYPNMKLTVDMKGDIEIIKAFWTTLRDKLFSLVVDSGLRGGHFNLDTDMSMFQLREGIMKKANHITDMELFDCEISGTLSQCELYRCKLNSSRLDKCKLIDSNEVSKSKIEKTTVMPGNVLTDCYINNVNETVEGTVIGGVLRKAILGKDVKISKTTLIVDVKGSDKKDIDSLSDAFMKKDQTSYDNIFKKIDNK